MTSTFKVIFNVNLTENLHYIYFYLCVSGGGCAHAMDMFFSWVFQDQVHITWHLLSISLVQNMWFPFSLWYGLFFCSFSCFILLLRTCRKQLGEKPGFSWVGCEFSLIWCDIPWAPVGQEIFLLFLVLESFYHKWRMDFVEWSFYIH